MSKEKQGFRETILALNEMFPDQGCLNRAETAKFLGVSPRTVNRIGIQFNKVTGRVTKANLAWQICI